MEQRQPALIGGACSDYRALWQQRDHGRDEYDLAEAVFAAALADCGLDRDGIDGLLVSRVDDGAGLARRLGIDPRWLRQADGRGRFCAPALLAAAAAVRRGEAETVAIVYANDGRSRRQTYGGQREFASQYADVYGFTSPGAWLGAAWRRYCHLYGADASVLAHLAADAHRAAALDPCSLPLPPVSEADYPDSPYITEPLRRADYCPVNDGAVCLILSRRRAAGCPAVLIAGGECLPQPPGLYMGEDFFFSTARKVAAALEGGGLSLSKPRPDLLLVYDNFTPNVVFALEGFGLCRQGEGWRDILTGGLPPLNPGGGMLAGSYMQGWNLLYEGLRQLQGKACARQVPGARRADYLCTAAVVSALVLEREDE